MYQFYTAIGKTLGIGLLPLIRPVLRRTRRTYAIIEYGGDVLLVKNWLGRQQWRLPGGGIGTSESPSQALLREISEELGANFSKEDLKFISQGTWSYDKLGHHYSIYRVVCKAKPVINPSRVEIIKAQWHNKNSLETLVLPAEITDALILAGLIHHPPV